MTDRRTFLLQMAGVAVALPATRQLIQESSGSVATPITVYKSSTCGCCVKWVDYVRANGFVPTVFDEEDIDGVKDTLGVPASVRSCHTAVVGSYLLEGHVPAPDIRRLLAQHPKVAGLAVPGMRSGTPGMAP